MSRSKLLSRDQIYLLEIEFTKSRSNLLYPDRNLLSRDIRIYYPEMEFGGQGKITQEQGKHVSDRRG